MSLLDEARLAVMLLTRLPVGRMREAPVMGAAVWAYPLAGALVGAVAGFALWLGGAMGVPPLAAAFMALAAGALATGGLHEDGLTDTFDALGGQTRARRLEIMRDSRIGSYGATALVIAVGMQASLIATLEPLELIAVGAVSRGFLPLLMWTMPQARPEGFGAAAMRGIDGGRVAGSVLLALVLAPFGAAAAALAVQFGVALLAKRWIGGLTGDVLGAAQVLGAIAAMMAMMAIS